MRARSFRERTAGERDGDGAATVTTPTGIVIDLTRWRGVLDDVPDLLLSQDRLGLERPLSPVPAVGKARQEGLAPV